MDELIGRLAEKVGIDNAVAEKTIGIILGFLRSEGPSDKVQALIDNIPGAEAAIAASSNGGGLARLMGGGLMALGTKLMALGLGMSEIQSVARELFRFGRDKIGADQMGEIISGTPGISEQQLLEWANFSDYMRIPGMGKAKVGLVRAAGVPTVRDLALRNPARLAQNMKDVNTKRKLLRVMPSEKSVGQLIAQARKLQPKISY